MTIVLGFQGPETEGSLTLEQVEAVHLTPYTAYYYQFRVCKSNNTSPLGRTKTTPLPNDHVTNVSLAVYSCSNYRKHSWI